MAAIVKANANLNAGGLATLRRNVTASDGVLNYDVDYVCLAQFSQNHTSFFRKGADPITPMYPGINGLNIQRQPKLYDFSLKIENGLAYLSARYAGPMPSVGSENGEFTITTSNDIKNITWTTEKQTGYSITPAGSVGGQANFVVTGVVTITNSFDYVSTTVSASSTNTPPQVVGSVGAPFNVKGNQYGTGAPEATTIDTNSSSTNSKGVTTYTATSTGIYTV